MSWAKVDDGWWCHAKVMPLGIAARGLWVSALSWSCHQRDALVPAHFLRLVGASDVEAQELVDAGLWHPEEGAGWRIHDWSDYQESSISEKRAEAGRKGGLAKARKSVDQGKGKQTPSKPDLPEVANGLAGALPSPSLPSQNTSPRSSENHSDREPELVAEPSEEPAAPDREQTIRRTAALIGRHVAAAQVGVTNPTGYATKVTRDILEGPDGIDRERITRLLDEGQAPEAIASGWGADPFGLHGAGPALSGPDLKAHYLAQQTRTAEQFAEQHRDPPEATADARAAARAALRGGLKLVQETPA